MVWWSAPYNALYLTYTTTVYWLTINLLDFAPNPIRRRILSNEYSGDALEKRLNMRIGGGWRVYAALWRMSKINMFPRLRVGDNVPKKELLIYPLLSLDQSPENNETAKYLPSHDNGAIDLYSFGNHDGKPVIINFGSCS